MTEQSVLTEEQNTYFDHEYVKDEYFENLVSILTRTFPEDAPIRVADFGSGNGLFLDRLLSVFPRATGYGIDISARLLSRNTPDVRKNLVNTSFLQYEPGFKFDILSLNWVLHHMVSGSVEETRQLIRKTVSHAVASLKPGGRLVVFENVLNGLVNDDLSSRLLHRGTSNKMIAGLTKRMGANTAGVGIYYLGRDSLLGLMKEHGMRLDDEFAGSFQPYGRKNLLFLARSVRERGFVFVREAGTT